MSKKPSKDVVVEAKKTTKMKGICNMTNEEVLTWARSIYYAHVDVGPDFCMYYSKARWEQQLAELSEEQRAMLVEHIERWEAMRMRVD